MRKCSIIMPLFALVAGGAGFYLRQVELNTVFDAVTGLAEPNAPATLRLIALSSAAALIIAVFALCAARKYTPRAEYARAFSPSGLLYLAVFFLLSAAHLAAVVLYFLNLRHLGDLAYIDMLFVAFAALSALSLFILALAAYRGRGGGEMNLLGVVPSIFFCLWLIIVYRQNASNPVLLDYCYQCIALTAASLSFYYGAGFVFKKPKPAKTIMSYLLTIYFCTLTLADEFIFPLKLILSVVVAAQLINSVQFIKNLKKITD